MWKQCVLCCGLLSSFAATATASDTQTVCNVLDSGVEKWRASLDFQCTYVFTRGIAATKEDALAQRFKRPPDRIVGVFNKRGEQLRLLVDFGKPPVDVSRDGSKSTFTDISTDVVMMNGLRLYYPLQRGDFGSICSIERQDGPVDGGNGFGNVFTPFEFGGGLSGAPLRNFGKSANSCKPDSVKTQVAHPDSKHIFITQSLKWPDGHTTVKKTTFWTAVSPAVIVREERVTDTSKRRSEGLAIGTDFVQCGGGMMARDVVSVAGPVIPVGKKEPVWVGTRWHSDDLGDRAPTDSDFVVTIPASTIVHGLSNPPDDGKERRINLADYTPKDLGDPLLARQASIETRESMKKTTVFVCLALIILLSCVLIMRLRRKRRLAQ